MPTLTSRSRQVLIRNIPDEVDLIITRLGDLRREYKWETIRKAIMEYAIKYKAEIDAVDKVIKRVGTRTGGIKAGRQKVNHDE